MDRNPLLREVTNLHHRKELAAVVTPDYFEPGMMEYLGESEGLYDAEAGTVQLRFEAKGTRYDGRTEVIEKVKKGSTIMVEREDTNPFNRNNFTLTLADGRNVGNMPAELCNAIAPLYDAGELVFDEAFVSFVEPLTKRNRHAKQAVLFVELHCSFV